MNLVRCNNGHFYDADKTAQCPHCAAGVAGNPGMAAPNRAAFNGMNYASTSEETVAYENGTMGEYGSTVDETRGGTGLGNAFGSQAKPVAPVTPVKPAVTPAQRFESEDDDSVTVRWTEGMNKEPVVGWLVGLNGEVAGESFEIKTGKNFIGRGDNMDVVLRGDKRVSRNKHAIIIYEPKNKMFMVQPGESRELFYLNGNVVLNTEKIEQNDRLYIGETELLFIPLCGENFSWDELGDKE